MRDALETLVMVVAALFIAGCLGLVIGIALLFRLLVLAVLIAPFWGFGLIALWLVGII